MRVRKGGEVCRRVMMKGGGNVVILLKVLG